MTVRLFFVGLLTAQAIAAVHVRLSNISHFQKIRGILESGYLAVPNHAVAETLRDWRPALFGGLFFTLTIGLSLTMLAVLAVRFWRRDHGRVLPVRIGIAALWIGLVGLMNSNGFSIAATAYGVLIPSAILAASPRLQKSGKPPRKVAAIHLAGLLLLTGVGIRHADTALFSGIRDHLLLSNAVGISVNNFYYRYTLYAAQAFKSLDQDLLRTCRLEGMESDPDAESRLRRGLAHRDWLIVEGGHPADMVVRRDRETLTLSHFGREILNVRAEDFMAGMKKVLGTFSAKTDRNAGLRWYVFISLMSLCLLLFYVTLYFPTRLIAGAVLGPTAAVGAAVAVTVAAGFGLLSLEAWTPWARQTPGVAMENRDALRSMLEAGDADDRIDALAYIYRKKLDVGAFADLHEIARRPDLRERCWLAKALSVSRNPDTLPVLLALLEDPQVNVAYQACHALGKRGDRRGIDALRELIGRSREWYVQLYAYRALRRLGWHQTGSG